MEGLGKAEGRGRRIEVRRQLAAGRGQRTEEKDSPVGNESTNSLIS